MSAPLPLLNPAHRWLAQRARNANYEYADRGYLTEFNAFMEAQVELDRMPRDVVEQAERELAGQLLLPLYETTG